jgi:hypothetical protein
LFLSTQVKKKNREKKIKDGELLFAVSGVTLMKFCLSVRYPCKLETCAINGSTEHVSSTKNWKWMVLDEKMSRMKAKVGRKK